MAENTSPTSTGLKENVAAFLCYLAWWITGIIFLILEPNNKNIKFHAFQSIIALGAIWVVVMVISFVPFIGIFLGPILGVFGAVVWVILMYKAYNGEKYKVPFAGDIAEKLAAK